MASNCVQTAITEGKVEADKRHYDTYFFITGNDVTISKDEELPEEIVEKLGKLETKKANNPNRYFQTLLGDPRLPFTVVDSDPN